MKNKMEVIIEAILKAIPDSEIGYRETKFVLHRFRIDRSGLPSCWLITSNWPLKSRQRHHKAKALLALPITSLDYSAKSEGNQHNYMI